MVDDQVGRRFRRYAELGEQRPADHVLYRPAEGEESALRLKQVIAEDRIKVCRAVPSFLVADGREPVKVSQLRNELSHGRFGDPRLQMKHDGFQRLYLRGPWSVRNEIVD